LAALCAEFDLPLLQAAGVIDRSPSGEVRLHPTLCDPAGALIALRANPAEAPFELLTAAGCVSRRTLTVPSDCLAAFYTFDIDTSLAFTR
jgi:hypothetical protein